jgi:hypothetical protein
MSRQMPWFASPTEKAGSFRPMELLEPIECPYCGQRFDLLLDTSSGSHQLTTDCEVCCRPLEVLVECEPGEVLSVTVAAG